ncbi:hypothetical protein CLV35_2425 [Motilibacter peucedani]|uniref:Uncharacterized protein n=1 Tax=Motilibacter peucedani TaxID=598650 RepID=A0A420XNZ8_9ACTN|nr:hypothetical protein [Motilibacter peucedani]RKS73929.1 hypothetical protein CLV35_2425 [Motilibacter peucedani]
MTHLRRAGLGLALAVPLALVGVAQARALTPGPGPATTVSSVALGSARVSLTGARVRLVPVSVHLVDPAGVQRHPASTDEERSTSCPCVRVEQPFGGASGGRAARTVVLRLTGGTAQDGTWSGTFPVSAQDAGTWLVRSLIAGTIDTRAQGFPSGTGWVRLSDVGTAQPPALRVTGRAPLLLTARARLVRKNTLRVTGTARVGRRPAAGIVLQVRALTCGDIEGPGGVLRRVRTSRAGTFSTVVSTSAFAIDSGVCVTYGPTGTSLQTALYASAGA